MLRKFGSAWRLLWQQGPGAVYRKLVWYAERYWTSDHWWMGKIVELRGNVALLDGCRFDLSNPVIQTPQKAGFLAGNYETGERLALEYLPTPAALPVIELGGSIGAMACVSSRYFGNPARHVVVEANPTLIPVLTRNRDLNGCRFSIIQAALAYGIEAVPFNVHPKFVKSSLYTLDASAQTVDVPTISLEQLLIQQGFTDNNIILFCDIEGAEVSLFEQEFDLLRRRAKFLALEVHPPLTGRATVDAMLRRLAEAGFRQLYRRKDNYLFENGAL